VKIEVKFSSEEQYDLHGCISINQKKPASSTQTRQAQWSGFARLFRDSSLGNVQRLRDEAPAPPASGRQRS
jgi:hypothetical protein